MTEQIDSVQMQPAAQVVSHDPDPKVAALAQHGDVALNFLETHEPVVFTPEEERRVVQKIDRVLMPLVCQFIVCILYCNVCSFFARAV
jgi:hypothetical protein